MPKKKIKKEEKEKTDVEMDDIVFEEEEKSGFGGSGQVKKLRDRLKKCTTEKQEYLDGWQRSKADFVNLKKEHSEQMERLKKFASEDVVNDLLPVIESFDMAFSDKKAWEAVDKNWRIGIEYIHTQLINALEDKGLKVINPTGEKFDHNKHDSIEIIESDDEKKTDIIAGVVQKGYMLNDKVIKPAKVKVYNYKK